MPDDTPILGLPLILPAQAQKHVTHNEALRLLDILVQLSVIDRDLAAPPALPAEGDRYIVAPAATGLWTGQQGKVAAFWGGVWVFIQPRQGWTAHVADEAAAVTYIDDIWTLSNALPETTPRLGVGTAPDSTNRLSIASPASLFSHAGTDHRMVLNKASPPDTASILLQSGFSGRAEIGLAGSDDLSFKVSADGTTFATALAANASGAITLPQGLTVGGTTTLSGPTTLSGTVTLAGTVTGAALQSSVQDGTTDKLMVTGAFGLGSTSAPPLANLDATTTLSGTWRTADVTSTGTWPPVATTTSTRNGMMTVTRPDPTTILQRWLQTDTATEWTRRNTGAGWSAWSRAIPVTGTVAMTAGLPTGSILERGTGSQGQFVRFADGTQICTHSMPIGPINLALGAIFQGAANVTWTFPAAFSSAPVVSGLAASTSAWLTAAAPGVSTVALRGCAATSQPLPVTAFLTAVGRWV